MLHRKRHVLFVLVLSSLLAAPATARQRDTGFLNRVVKVDGVEYRYQVYVPADWSKHQKWPVILFLHGAGERGEDGLFPSEIGIGNAIRRHAERFPCIVVIPQCRKDGWWTHANMEAQVFKALDQAVKEFQGDTQRLYLTGLSMGGYGAMKLGLKYPQMFSAAASLSGAFGAARWTHRPIEDAVFQKLIEGVYGPRENPGRAAEDPFELIKKVPAELCPQLYISVGSGDFLLDENREFVRLLGELKVSYEYREFPGKHEWPVWDREIQVVLALQAPVIGVR